MFAMIGMGFATSILAAPNQYLVPGSQNSDFGITCWEGEKRTFAVHESMRDDYRHARNIVFTDMGGGRGAISMLHGSSNATTDGTYLTSAAERCETFKQ